MQITNVEITTDSEHDGGKLLGFATITLDGCFVIRDVKIISGPHGPFVAMPSRKITKNCAECTTKNHLLARFCNGCGGALNPHNSQTGERIKLHCDVAHPINPDCRAMIERAVLVAFDSRCRQGQERVA